MSSSLKLLASLGLVFLLFSLIAWFSLTADAGYFIYAHLILAVVFFVSFIVKGGFQLLTGAAIKRKAGFGLGAVIYSVIFIALLVLINYAVFRKDFLHFDSTEQKVYTLAPQSLKVLSLLKQPVVIRAFYLGGELEPELKELLDRMKRVTSNLSVEVVDPERSPLLTEKYGISERQTLHFSFADSQSSRQVKIVRIINEQEIVNALLKLTRGGDKKIYFLTGHGESDLDEKGEAGYLFLREAIEGENIAVARFELGATAQIPPDASALLIMAPRRPLLESEKKALDSYLQQGGSAMLLNEPNTTDDIAELVKPFGIIVGSDIIVEPTVRLFSAPVLGLQPVINQFSSHPVTREFRESIVLSTVSSVTVIKEPERVSKDSMLEVTSGRSEIAFTGNSSWAETNLNLIFSSEPQAYQEEGDIPGPVAVASAFEGSLVSTEGNDEPAKFGQQSSEEGQRKNRLVVIGDADFVANVNLRQLFNRDFFLNCLNWVLGEEEVLTIRSGTLRASTKELSNRQLKMMFLFGGIMLPELLLLFGVVIWSLGKR